MKLARFVFVLAVAALAACGGGGSGSVPAARGLAPVGPAQASPSGTPAPNSATATQTFTSSATKLTFPALAGYSGTMALPMSGMLGAGTMTMTTSTSIPGGIPTVLDHRRANAVRHTLSSVLAPQLYETVSSSDTVVFDGFPAITFTVPTSVVVSSSVFFLTEYDPLLGEWTDLGRMTAYRQTLSSVVYGVPTFTMQGNLGYTFATYSFPVEHPTSTFASAACPTPALAAPSANGALWCAQSGGFEKITSSGSSTVSLPDPSYAVEGVATGPDGNVWFTAQSGADTLGTAAIFGKIDQTSGTITTYTVPNPSSFPTASASFQAGSIVAGPSSLYFLAGADFENTTSTQTFVETASTAGSVTHSVPLGYATSANAAAMAYGSDGNVWLAAETASQVTPWLVTKISPSSGVLTNYSEFACPQLFFPASMVQGGDGNFYVPTVGEFGFSAVCTITQAGVATATPIAPYPVRPSNLTLASDGSVWYSVPDGVARVFNGSITQYADPALHDVSQGVFGMPNGMLWEVGTFPSSPGVQVLNPASP